MFNHHSIIPWGSFRGRQEEKWGSFRGRDHFGVNLGIISGWGSFRGRDHFGGCTDSIGLYVSHKYHKITYDVSRNNGSGKGSARVIQLQTQLQSTEST